MSLTMRYLPPDEWPRLKGTEAEMAWRHFNPENTMVVVVEEDGEIVATWSMLRTVHAECIWVAPSHRGSVGVARRLFKGLRDAAEAWGVQSVVTGSVSPDVTDLILRFGGKPMPCESWILPVKGRLSRGHNLDLEVGRYFHYQLSEILSGEQHPDDDKHDEMVGHALRTAVEKHAPELAMEEYNSWATGAGYEPIKYLGTVDGKMRADIVTAIIEMDDHYSVSVLKGAECQ